MAWPKRVPVWQDHAFVPMYRVSATRIDMFTECQRAWGYRELFGWKEPPKLGAAMGTLTHDVLEQLLKGGISSVYAWTPSSDALEKVADVPRDKVDAMIVQAPERALPILPHLPKVERALSASIERDVVFDHKRYISPGVPGADDLVISILRDLVVVEADRLNLVDHKTTKAWKWVPAPEDIVTKAQGIFYALQTLNEYPHFDIVHGRWVYTITDLSVRPEGRPVDFVVDRATCEARAIPLLHNTAIPMSRLLRRHIAHGDDRVEDLAFPTVLPPEETAPCYKYRGCPFWDQNGGPCRPGGKSNSTIVMQQLTQEILEMTQPNPYANVAGMLNPPVVTPPANVAAMRPPIPAYAMPVAAPVVAPVAAPVAAPVDQFAHLYATPSIAPVLHTYDPRTGQPDGGVFPMPGTIPGALSILASPPVPAPVVAQSAPLDEEGDEEENIATVVDAPSLPKRRGRPPGTGKALKSRHTGAVIEAGSVIGPDSEVAPLPMIAATPTTLASVSVVPMTPAAPMPEECPVPTLDPAVPLTIDGLKALYDGLVTAYSGLSQAVVRLVDAHNANTQMMNEAVAVQVLTAKNVMLAEMNDKLLNAITRQ